MWKPKQTLQKGGDRGKNRPHLCTQTCTMGRGDTCVSPATWGLFESCCALISAVLSAAFEVKIPVTFAPLAFASSLQTRTDQHLYALSG